MICTIYFPLRHGQQYQIIGYPAGESQVRLTEPTLTALKDAESVRVVATITANSQIMDLALLVDAINRVAEFKKVQLVLPYLPYARADRRFVEGDCHGLNVFGKIVDSMLVDEVVTLDVHSKKASQHVSRLRNVSPMPLIMRAYHSVYSKGARPTILLPDAGSIDRYAFLQLVSVKNCEKVRDASTGQLSGFKVPAIVNDRVLIVDDICDGGGTFIGIAKLLPKNVKKYLYVTHGIFSKGLRELTGHFEHIYTTNSYPHGYDDKYVTTYNALELL